MSQGWYLSDPRPHHGLLVRPWAVGEVIDSVRAQAGDEPRGPDDSRKASTNGGRAGLAQGAVRNEGGMMEAELLGMEALDVRLEEIVRRGCERFDERFDRRVVRMLMTPAMWRFRLAAAIEAAGGDGLEFLFGKVAGEEWRG